MYFPKIYIFRTDSGVSASECHERLTEIRQITETSPEFANVHECYRIGGAMFFSDQLTIFSVRGEFRVVCSNARGHISALSMPTAAIELSSESAMVHFLHGPKKKAGKAWPKLKHVFESCAD